MAKKQRKKRRSGQAWKYYEVSSGLKRVNKTCPKCGQGVFMAKHKDRYTCGNCHYTEFMTKETKKPMQGSQS